MQILAKRVIHSGSKFDFALHEIRTASGETIERGFIDHPGSVVMIPVLPGNRIVMVRQFRHPCQRTFLELPAGTAHPGENLEVTAIRELAEETGYRSARMDRVFEMFPLPGAASERMAYFRCLELSPGPVQREIDEEMDVEILALDDAIHRIDTGEICDGKTIIGLWLEERERLGRGPAVRTK